MLGTVAILGILFAVISSRTRERHVQSISIGQGIALEFYDSQQGETPRYSYRWRNGNGTPGDRVNLLAGHVFEPFSLCQREGERFTAVLADPGRLAIKSLLLTSRQWENEIVRQKSFLVIDNRTRSIEQVGRSPDDNANLQQFLRANGATTLTPAKDLVRSIQAVDLIGGAASVGQVEYLKKLPALRSINLWDCRVDIATLEALFQLDHVEYLDFQMARVGPDALRLLIDSLPSHFKQVIVNRHDADAAGLRLNADSSIGGRIFFRYESRSP